MGEYWRDTLIKTMRKSKACNRAFVKRLMPIVQKIKVKQHIKQFMPEQL